MITSTPEHFFQSNENKIRICIAVGEKLQHAHGSRNIDFKNFFTNNQGLIVVTT